MPTWNEFAWAVFYYAAISTDITGNTSYLHLRGDKPFLENLRTNQVSYKEIQDKIVGFLNGWRCRIPKSERVAEAIKKAISEIQAEFSFLYGLKIESIMFTQAIENAIKNCYNRIQRIENFGPTATSKLLYILMPELFVMWDQPILYHYRQKNPKISGNGEGYHLFLNEMKSISDEIIASFHGDELDPPAKLDQTPAEYLSEQLRYSPKKTLAKYLDEYNWIRFTYKLQVPPTWHP